MRPTSGGSSGTTMRTGQTIAPRSHPKKRIQPNYLYIYIDISSTNQNHAHAPHLWWQQRHHHARGPDHHAGQGVPQEGVQEGGHRARSVPGSGAGGQQFK